MQSDGTFASKLRRELEARDMGARTLAKLIAPDNVEQQRKTVRRWLAGTHVPTAASRRSVTDALGLLPGSLDPEEEESLDAPLTRALREAVAADPSAARALRRLLERAEA